MMKKLQDIETKRELVVSQTTQARCYIIHELIKKTKGQFLKENYLTKDDMIADYAFEHEEEIMELFPNASISYFIT